MKELIRILVMGAIVGTLAACAGMADSIQPIVNTKQVLYGSAQKTIASNSDVTIDTQTHRLGAQQGITTNQLKFNDGTVITSTSTLGGSTTWGSITGTLSNQTDLNSRLVSIGVSTSALSASTTTLGSSVSTLQSQVATIGTSTGSLQTQVTALGVSTTTLGSSITAINSTLATVGTSTASLQSQINAALPVSLSTGVIGTLAPSHLVSTVAYTTAGQTFSAGNTFSSPSGNTFTFGVNAGSVTDNDLSASQFVVTDASRKLSSTNLLANNNVWTSSQSFTSPSDNRFTYGITVGSLTFTGIANNWIAVDQFGHVVATAAVVDAGSQITGILPVAHGGSGSSSPGLVAGTNVTVTGSWPNQTITAAGGSAGTLGVTTGTASGFTSVASSPTAVINFDNTAFNVSLKGGATAYVTFSASSVTLQGNTFNNANQLVQLSAGNQLPIADGNLLANLNAAALVGTIPSGNLSNAILSQSTLQTGATFYTSSGTVTNLNTTILKFSDGTTQTSGATNPTNFIANQNTLQSGATFYVSSGTAQNLTSTNFVTSASTMTTVVISSETLLGPLYGTNTGITLLHTRGTALNSSTANLFVGGGAGNVSLSTTSAFGETGVGAFALRSLTNGRSNTAVGGAAGTNITSGQFNDAFGQGTLATISSQSDNAAFGAGALSELNSGNENVCMGYACGGYLTSGSLNTAIGFGAMFSDARQTSASNNVAIGQSAGGSGNENVFVGDGSGSVQGGGGLEKGNNDVYIGALSGPLTEGTTTNAIAIGYGARPVGNNTAMIGGPAGSGNDVTTYVSSLTVNGSALMGTSVIYPSSSQNIYIGDGALSSRTSGSVSNVAIGNSALFDAAGNLSQGNVAIGDHALTNDPTSQGNTAIGYQSLNTETTGTFYNTAVGYHTNGSVSGSSCTYVGANAGSSGNFSDSIAIGNNATVTASNQAVIGGAGADAVNVVMSSLTVNGQSLLTGGIVGPANATSATSKTYEVTAGTVGISGPYNFSVSTNGVLNAQGGIKGVTNGGDATAGNVGEIIQQQIGSGSPRTLSSGVTVAIATITLTAGDWDVYGVAGYIPGGTVSSFFQSSGITSQVFDNEQSMTVVAFPSAITPSLAGERFAFGTARYSVSTNTPIYLNVQSTFGTSMTAFGTITARRAQPGGIH